MKMKLHRMRACTALVACAILLGMLPASAQMPDLSGMGAGPDTAKVPALESTPLVFTDGVAEVKLTLTGSTVYHFDVADAGDLYTISAEAADPVSIVLEANRIELNAENQPTGRTKLLSEATRGFGDRTARLPLTTFQPGRIYLGLAPLDPVEVTLKVERRSPPPAGAALPDAPGSASAGGDDITGPGNGKTQCVIPKRLSTNAITDLILVSSPQSRVEMVAYNARRQRLEARSGTGTASMTGIRGKDIAICVTSSLREGQSQWRLLARPGTQADGPTEPNANPALSARPDLTMGKTYTLPLDMGDVDAFSLAKLAAAGRFSIQVSSIADMRLCLRETDKKTECVDGKTLSLSPFLITQDTELSIENRSTYSADYELKLERLGEAANELLLEPNAGQDTQPLLDGEFRIGGSLSTADDRDTVGFHTGDTAQLWRIMVLGDAVRQIDLSDIRGKISDHRRGSSSGRRVVMPDVYLEPGPAYITVTGRPGDYKIIAKPLGAPRSDSEREPNGLMPRRLALGETVTGIATEGDDDLYSLYLPRDALVNVSLEAPAGAEYFLTFSAPSDVSERNLDRQVVPAGKWRKTVAIPAGEHVLRLQPRKGSPAEYKLSARYANPFPAPSPSPVKLSVANAPQVSAYSVFRQRATALLKITNTSREEVSGTLDFWFARPGIEVIPYTVTLAPGKTLSKPVSLMLPDDLYDGDLPFFVAVRDETGTILASTRGLVKADAGTRPVKPIPARHVPPEMAGGINLARTSLGAKWMESDGIGIGKNGDYQRGNPANAQNLLTLIDGYITQGKSHEGILSNGGKHVLSPVLDLPGDSPLTIVGVGINTRLDDPQGLLGFGIDVSNDAKSWREVLTGEHTEWGPTTYYAFPAGPTQAKYIRLRSTKRRGSETSPVSLSGFEVIAAPGKSGLKNLNIADKALGALVSGTRNMAADRHFQIDGEATKAVKLTGKGKGLTDFNNAITFRNQLTAEIASVEAVYPSDQRDTAPPYASAAIVFASAYGPTGPFQEIGRFDLPASPEPGQVVKYELPEWSSARAVKIEYEHAEGSYFQAPMMIRLIERPEDETYRSVLGTWGEFATSKSTVSQSAPDLMQIRATLVSWHKEVKNLLRRALRGGRRAPNEKPVASPASTALLAPGASFSQGFVAFGTQTETWRVPAEGQTNQLKIILRGSPGFDPAISAATAAGEAVKPVDIVATELRDEISYRFPVEPGSYLDIEISDPQHSVVFLMDQSASMASQIPKIRRAIIDFADDMVAARDAVQFKSFGGDWARENWVTDANTLRTALANYKGADNSAGEAALLDAARKLETQEGSRAIVMITDGDVNTQDGLMASLRAARARVFVIKTPSNSTMQNPTISQPLSLLWAGETGGEVSMVLQSEDISVAYARVKARLLGMKPYDIRAEAETVILKPGFLQVDAGTATGDRANGRSQMIILDASGSMLKRLGSQRRIDLAKTALGDYLTAQQARLDAGAGLETGLRIFGGEPESCDTELARPLAPFDKDRLASAISSVRPQNNAKTAIGAGLFAAGEDLKGAAYPASILLITDGEETCGGNPMLSIAHLKRLGIEARVDVVSYALEPEVDRAPFEAWAKAGGGLYIDAEDGADLQAALQTAALSRFKVYQGEDIIATGLAGQDAIKLSAGTYEVQVDGGERLSVTINPEKTTRLTEK
ncbi:vWA domain-containing protein [Hyphomonas beringensis]|nr:VWA domain-containing protein [Hyphomonas beringensis]